MDFYVLRNKRMVNDLCESLKRRSLPFKCALQDIYPLRSPEANAYLWGIVYSMIASETGQSIDDVHEGYRRLYNYTQEFRYNPRTRQMQFYVGAGTTIIDERAFWDYCMKVRSDAEISLGIIIQLPNECFVKELNFDFERKHKTKRL